MRRRVPDSDLTGYARRLRKYLFDDGGGQRVDIVRLSDLSRRLMIPRDELPKAIDELRQHGLIDLEDIPYRFSDDIRIRAL